MTGLCQADALAQQQQRQSGARGTGHGARNGHAARLEGLLG